MLLSTFRALKTNLTYIYQPLKSSVSPGGRGVGSSGLPNGILSSSEVPNCGIISKIHFATCVDHPVKDVDESVIVLHIVLLEHRPLHEVHVAHGDGGKIEIVVRG